MSRVVVIISDASSVAALGDLGGIHDLTIVGAGDTADIGHPLVPAPRGRLSAAVVSFAWCSTAGRNAIRISPLDESRRLWRAARRDAALREIIRSADVVVAGDRDAIFTVWKLTRSRRHGSQWSAVYGVSAARFVLSPG